MRKTLELMGVEKKPSNGLWYYTSIRQKTQEEINADVDADD
jgi:hypothetical protein